MIPESDVVPSGERLAVAAAGLAGPAPVPVAIGAAGHERVDAVMLARRVPPRVEAVPASPPAVSEHEVRP
ncbi:hypothetical protein [Burkholderia plantarii]|uniref:hypothetical protein n=1 Tax=Burkholderia plantarii TaxID=41899 RepID=UPI0018DDDDC5|nr:hypothetical protein [Burkholderia plantarii]MBI0329305.1 hypothetical protein [Burkholderia plantarii]